MDELADKDTIRNAAAQEAIFRLELLKPEASATIARLLESDGGYHPRAICTAYRKEGDQLSSAAKRERGISVQAFMSEQAYEDLAPRGKADPIRAHETTLLRATFVMARFRDALHARDFMREYPDEFSQVLYDVYHHDACDYCLSLDKKAVGSDWAIFPAAECTCVTAPYAIRHFVDFSAGVFRREHEEQRSQSSFWGRLKRHFAF